MAFGDETREWLQRKKTGLFALLSNFGGTMEAYAKTNAPWTDRTGNARQGLHGGVELRAENELVLFLSHGVEYGIWLELANAGKYAIVGPTADVHLNRIRSTVMRYWED